MFIPNKTPLSEVTISRLEGFIKRHQHNAEGYFLISKKEHFERFCEEYLYLKAVNGGSVSTVLIMRLLRKTFETPIGLYDCKRLTELFNTELKEGTQSIALDNLYSSAFNLAYGE